MGNFFALKRRAAKSKALLHDRRIQTAVGVYFVLILLMMGLQGTKFGSEIGISIIGYYIVFITLWAIFAVLTIMGYIVLWDLVKAFMALCVVITIFLLLAGNDGWSLLALGPALYIIMIFLMFGLFFLGSVLGSGAIVGGLFCLPLIGLAAGGGDPSNIRVLAVMFFVIGFLLGSYVAWKIYVKIILPFSFGFSFSFAAAQVASLVAGVLFVSMNTADVFEFMYIMINPRYYSMLGDMFALFVQHFGIMLFLSILVGLGTIFADADIRSKQPENEEITNNSQENEESSEIAPNP